MTSTASKVHLHAPDSLAERRLQWLEIAPLLDRCSQQLRCVLRDSAAAHELNERHAMILWLCSGDPSGSAQNHLAEQLAVSPPQLSLLLEQLRQRGVLESVRDPRDRRRQRNQLTATGRRIWTSVAAELGRQLQQFDATLSSEQFGQLCELLQRLMAAELDGPRLHVVALPGANEQAIQETDR